jgi:hypothetical protein
MSVKASFFISTVMEAGSKLSSGSGVFRLGEGVAVAGVGAGDAGSAEGLGDWLGEGRAVSWGDLTVWQARPRLNRGIKTHKREYFIKIYYTALIPMSKPSPVSGCR